MKRLTDIANEAASIIGSHGAGYEHADKQLAELVESLALHLIDAIGVIDDLVSANLDRAGIDINPIYDRVKKMVESTRHKPASPAPVEQAAREESDRDLLSKINATIASDDVELVPSQRDHGAFLFRRKPVVPPAPERRDYAQKAIDEYFGSLSSVKTITSEEGRYMVRSAVASYSEDVERVLETLNFGAALAAIRALLPAKGE